MLLREDICCSVETKMIDILLGRIYDSAARAREDSSKWIVLQEWFVGDDSIYNLEEDNKYLGHA